MSRVLVTGAAGFIGRHLLSALLKEGYEAIGLDKLDAEEVKRGFLVGDICDNLWMGDKSNFDSLDSVVHLAASAAPRIAETKPDETFRVNVYGTYNVLKMAKEAGVKRVVFASSAHVYGINPKYIPTDEMHPLALHDTYMGSKIIGERLCQLFYENYNMSYVALRQFNGYGPGQSLNFFIPATINQAIHGSIVLRGRHVTKDFVYVDDMVDAMVKALESEYVGPLNVGTGVQTKLEDVAAFIANYFDVPLTFAETDDKGPTRMQCDASRIKRVLGWTAKTSLEEGLTKTIESMKG